MADDDLARARRTGTAAWVWLAVGGAVSLALGLASLVAPGSTLGVLAVVLSLWLLAAGLGRVGLASALRTSSPARRGLQGVLGVALAAAGVAGLLGLWDALTVVTVVVAVGFLVAAVADLGMAATGPRGAGASPPAAWAWCTSPSGSRSCCCREWASRCSPSWWAWPSWSSAGCSSARPAWSGRWSAPPTGWPVGWPRRPEPAHRRGRAASTGPPGAVAPPAR
jgi:hypothetical protein